MQSKWWKEGIIYQIYPRSFQDSNGDGVGDLPGIISRLDYIEKLGVNIIWLNPIYKSPNDDNGYDISNYYEIHPEFGTMDDFDQLLKELHRRNIRLLMDVVVNHTSDEHPWFILSEDDPGGPYGDFYFWREGKEGGPPNNWPSFFGGPAWSYSEKRGAYYLHLFSAKQPDLNWEHPRVREECKNILRFWLDKGIDGFRMDVIPLISKRLDFADTNLSTFKEIVEQVYSNGPRVHEYLRDLHRSVFSHYDMMTVGEGPGISPHSVNGYVGAEREELNMIFQLDHMVIDHGPEGRFDPQPFNLLTVKKLFLEWDQAVAEKGWLSSFLDNHDFPRMVSRFADDGAYRKASAKLLAMLVLTQRATPCIYFGSEIGMTNLVFDSISDCRDVETHNHHKILINRGVSEPEFLRLVETQGRDNVRSPMQWSDANHAGFTNGTPWIKVNPNFIEINVKRDTSAADSIYEFYRQMINIRKENLVLTYGAFRILEMEHPSIFAYTRSDDRGAFLVLMNLSATPQRHHLVDGNWEVILNNYPNYETPHEYLRPWEAVLFKSKVLDPSNLK